jgi:hypothetical protein
MRRHVTLIVACILLALGTAILPAMARVFLRTGKASKAGPLADLLDGETVYDAKVQLNDGQGDVSILLLSTSYLAAIRRFTHSGIDPADGDLLFFPSRTMGNGLLYNKQTVTRLLLFDLIGRDQCMLFMLRQTTVDYEKSLAPPATHCLTEIAGYPGSNPLAFWRNFNTRLTVATARTGDEPQRIINYYAGMLTTDGWHGVPGDPSRLANTPRALFFVKDQQFCAITTKESDSDETIITILHKQLGTE